MSKNQSTTSYGPIFSITVITLSLIGNFYLYTQYQEQNNVIEMQQLQIKQLKEELANAEMQNDSPNRYFQKIFNHSWPNLRMPLWEADDIIEKKTSRSQYTSASSSKSEKEYLISTILPGFAKEDITIELDHNILKIHAKNNSLDHTKEHDQSIKIPEDADLENIDVELSNGILKITIPRTQKKEQQESRKIMIK